MTMNDPARPFWTINIGHIVMLITMIAGFIVFLMKFENRISQIENNQHSLSDTVAQQRQMIERMDNQGTNASQRGILRDVEAVSSNTRRIENLERIATDLVPKVERIDVNVANLLGKKPNP